jgi:uncharacterized protein YqjF (DUF2071 family)
MKRAVMKQGWYDLVYLHFSYDPDVVARLLPPGLEVDTYDDKAWVGLIPFSMRGIGLPKLPAIPYFGSFPEVNVRTYVKRNGVSGVWFFSLDINRLAPTLVARTAYKLPYCFGSVSHMREGNDVFTTVRRRWPRSQMSASADTSALTPRTSIHARYENAVITPTEFDDFLTARWGLFSHAGKGTIRYAPVDHPDWSLRRASLVSLDDSLVTAAGLPTPDSEPYVLYSPGVPVLVGLPHKV